MSLFRDRRDAGRELAASLAHEAASAPVIVGLPRGGVVVAAEVARALDAPLDALVVKKLGVPNHEEMAMGAIAEGNVVFDDAPSREMLGIDDDIFAATLRSATRALRARAAELRAVRPSEDVRGRVVIIVDDGIATGATARVAVQAMRARGASRVVLAAPVSLGGSERALREVADDVVVVAPVDDFAIGGSYDDFRQVETSEVIELLRGAAPATRQLE